MQRQDPAALSGLKKLIAKAEVKVANQPLTGAAQAGVDQTATRLQVSVTLDQRLISQVLPDDTLFVFARALQGPKMPLAVVRKTVGDLPLTVSLDDSMAMLPEMRLSNFDDIRVGARISRSGGAIPQSGDLQGETSPVRREDAGVVQVIISRIIP
jgi:cytochrome c-type biogenesis protein CcmH